MSGLAGRRVLVLDARRSDELRRLLEARGAEVVVAPATRVVPLDPGPDVVELAARLRRGDLDAMLFLTETGVRLLPQVAAPVVGRGELLTALSKVTLGARGPRAAAALSELGLSAAVVSAPPHESGAFVAGFDRAHPVAGRSVALVESGRIHSAARAALVDRGADLVGVGVYRWDLPEDRAPLDAAVRDLVSGRVQVVLLTKGAQVDHLAQVAAGAGQTDALRAALGRVTVGAIGQSVAARAEAFGVADVAVAETPHLDRLVEAVERSS